MRVAGVDPGGSGALALLEGPSLIAVTDMPIFVVTRGKGSGKELDAHGLRQLLETWAPDVLWFEKVGPMSTDGAMEAFRFGDLSGGAKAICKLFSKRFEPVLPQTWKKEMGLIGKTKDDSRVMATNMWPAAAGEFRRKMDEGRAEAALIAEYGRRQLNNRGIFA